MKIKNYQDKIVTDSGKKVFTYGCLNCIHVKEKDTKTSGVCSILNRTVWMDETCNNFNQLKTI